MSGPDRRSDARGERAHMRYRLLVAATIDGRIDAEDAADLEAHLLTCDACTADLAAMQADHRLLAAPARVAGPDPRVRVAVLHAARGSRVPRVGDATRPWTALLAAGLVVALAGTSLLFASLGPASPGATGSSSASPTAPPAPSGFPGPVGIASGHFAGIGPGTGALDVDIRLLGPVERGGSATVAVVGPYGESWTGRVTRSQFWADAGDPRGYAWVAYLEGCKSGTSCDAFQLMLVDARDTDGRDRIVLDFYPSLAEIDQDGPFTSYELTAGSLEVTGPIRVIP